MHNPFRLLEYNAKNFPEKPALDELTFQQLSAYCRRVAGKLGKLGVSSGQLVATSLPGKLDWIFTLALFHEACITCSNQGYTELNPAFEVDWIITNQKCDWFPEDRQIVVDQAWLDGLADEVPAGPCKDYGSEDALCRLFLTSGTTGYPKAAVFSVGLLMNEMSRLRSGDGLTPTAALSVLPLCTSFGFFIAMNALFAAEPCYFAATIDKVIGLLESGKITYLLASPFQLSKIVERIEGKKDFQHSVKTILTGGAYVSPVLYDKVMETFGAEFYSAYGSTEAGRTCINPLRSRKHLQFAGLVVYDTVIEILDHEGAVLPAGKEGEIRVKCPYVIPEYYKDPKATEKALRDGWFYPGDRGYLTKNGVLALSGRADELINRGGVKVDPARLDHFLQSYEGIQDAAVVGVENAEGVQEIVGAVVVEDDFDFKALQTAMSKVFGRAALPNRYVKTNAIPRNQMGKVERVKIKRALLANEGKKEDAEPA